MGPQSVAARKDAQILQHDRFKQRSHQFVWRRADFLQTVDVGLGKHPALACDFVQFDSVITLIPRLHGGNFQLGIDFVDDRASPAGALVIHRGNLFLAAGLFVVFEDDDLGVLPAELDDRIHLGMHLLDGERDCRDFLDELCADPVGDPPPPEPVRNIRVLLAIMPTSDSMRFRNSRVFSGCLVSWR